MGHVSLRMMQLALAGLVLCAALGLWMGFDDAHPRADSVRQRLTDSSVVAAGPEPTAAVAMSDDAVDQAAQAIVEDAPAASDAATSAAAVTASEPDGLAAKPRKAPRPTPAAAEPPRPQPAPAPAAPQDPVGDLIAPAPAEDPPF